MPSPLIRSCNLGVTSGSAFPARVRCYPVILLPCYATTLLPCYTVTLLLLLYLLYISDTYIFSYLGHAFCVTKVLPERYPPSSPALYALNAETRSST